MRARHAKRKSPQPMASCTGVWTVDLCEGCLPKGPSTESWVFGTVVVATAIQMSSHYVILGIWTPVVLGGYRDQCSGDSIGVPK